MFVSLPTPCSVASEVIPLNHLLGPLACVSVVVTNPSKPFTWSAIGLSIFGALPASSSCTCLSTFCKGPTQPSIFLLKKSLLFSDIGDIDIKLSLNQTEPDFNLFLNPERSSNSVIHVFKGG